jgi:exodeoxyribonuclease V beta subunit
VSTPLPSALPPVPFRLDGPLPTGTTVLEASAGTGKTYTIAGLVTRYVAEGQVQLEQMLVVTFGRAATSELRTRVRERLLETRDALRVPTVARGSGDPVVALLAQGSDDEVAERRERLSAGVASFDAATVATTHEFCLSVLHGLGTAADLDPGTELVESLDDLVTEVCDDLYLRWHAYSGATAPVFGRDTALAVARAAYGNPESSLIGEGATPDSPATLRVRFAGQVRREVDRRARARRVMGFDSLLLRVRDALADDVTGHVARKRLRERYRVVLVDEFQDTDPVQWEVLSRAFHGHRTLIVIGDPKQAVYAFRGADVHAYLAASEAAGTRATLGTNWRSDPRLLDGLSGLFRGAVLGDDRIVVRDVGAGHPNPALGPEADDAPVRLRIRRRDGLDAWQGLPKVGPAREAVAADVAREVVELLRSGATVTARGRDARPRALRAGDVAVLVRKATQAQMVREALARAGVPSVLTGTSSVFATEAAQSWVVLLEALEQPHRTGRVRRLALTPLIGWDAREVDEGGEAASDALALRLREWADVLATRGVAALFSTVAESQRLAQRLLRRPDGERTLTDLRHVAETLHREATSSLLGLAGLLSWLRERVEESGGDLDQERSRRLDTDAAAVQVLTVHTSKGLQFPVVLVPFGWDTFGGGSREQLPRGHGETGRRELHVGGTDAPDYADACARAAAEDAGEELRLLYVAMTRAVSRLVLWWAPTKNACAGPLHRLLFCEDPATEVPLEVPVPDDDRAVERLRLLAASGDGIAVQVVEPSGSAGPAPAAPGARAGDLAAAEFDRGLDLGWRRTSYSGLTRAVHEEHAVGSEPQAQVKDDEDDEAALHASADPEHDRLRDVASPMGELPGGTGFGTLVHAVLEDADLSVPDVREELRRVAAEHLRDGAGTLAPDVLADALVPAVSTPLGPLADGLRFRDVAPADRLDELAFELPLVGGDSPTSRVRLGEVAALLDEHLLASDRVAPYAQLLRSPALADQVLRGYLTGSVDVVLRVTGPRYVVVDHKTNRLADRGVPLTAWHYRPAALDTAVLSSHYPLQAMLYCVALHRFLRWRQAGYDPEQHLGGVLYLFLRGMCGEAAAIDAGVAGVWDWRPPPSLVVALSDLLGGQS